jgi:hypothetical protein
MIRADVIYPGHSSCQHIRPDTRDEVWLPEAGRNAWVVVMRDKHIRSRPGERRALIESGLRTFCLTSSGNASKWDILSLLVVNWKAMARIAREVPGPYIHSITQGGVRPLALRPS